MTFSAICSGSTWENMLVQGRLANMVRRCRYPFAAVLLTLAADAPPEAISAAEAARQIGLVTAWETVGRHEQDLDAAFGSSSHELVAIHTCQTRYILHFGPGSMQEFSDGWIDDAIDRLQTRRQCLLASPARAGDFMAARERSIGQDEAFYVDRGFDSHCYLLDVTRLRDELTGWRECERQDLGFEEGVRKLMEERRYLRLTSKRAATIR